MLRAATALGVVVAVALACLVHSAEARMGEALAGFGRELSAWTDAHPQSAPRALAVNGLQLELMTVTTELDIKRALDHFHALCRNRGGVREPASRFSAWPDSVLRREADHEGVLACLDTGGPLGVAQLSERLQTFAKTGDLADLGKLRYVLARRSGKATTLLVLWTDRSAQLLNFIPKSGDAAGRDPRDFPRAAGMRRLLSAAELGAPYALALYEAGQQSPAALLSWYEAQLAHEGWSVTRTGDRLMVQKQQRTVAMNIRTLSGGKTAVTVAELS